LDGVPEGARDQYVERDGKYHLELDGDVHTDDDIAGLKSALSKERDARKTLEKKMKTSTLTAEEKEELARLKKEKEDAETKRLESKGEYDKLIKKMEEKHKKELEALNGNLSEEKSRTTRLVVKDKIRAAAIASGVLKENIEDVITLTSNRFRLDGDDIVVLDDEGELSADSVKGFFEKTFKESRPIYYEPSGGPGTGANQNEASRKSHSGAAVVLTHEDAKIPQKYREAKALAAERGVEFQVEKPDNE
jgi:hypothetical protein